MLETQDVLSQIKEKQKICLLIISQIYQMRKEEFKEREVSSKKVELMLLLQYLEQ